MARDPHHDAVRYYRWIWSVICALFHRKHHELTGGAFYHAWQWR